MQRSRCGGIREQHTLADNLKQVDRILEHINSSLELQLKILKMAQQSKAAAASAK